MILGEFISQIERQTGSSITDPLVLGKELRILLAGEEATPGSVDVDGDVIVLEE